MKKNLYAIAVAVMMLLPFCANQKSEPVTITRGEIVAHIQMEALKTACERRLSVLEADTQADTQAAPRKRATAPNLSAVRASDPVHK